MNIFPVLTEAIQFNGTSTEAESKLRDLVQSKKFGIELKYTKPFYGFVSVPVSKFRISKFHGGYYWINVVLIPNDKGTMIQFKVDIPRWRRIALLCLLGVLLPGALAILFLVPSWRDLHFALYPLLFAWAAWSGKRDDYFHYTQSLPILLEPFHSEIRSSAP